MLFTKRDQPSLNPHQQKLDGSLPAPGPPQSVLTIIDFDDEGRSLDEIFHHLGWKHHRCRSVQQAFLVLRKHTVSAILVDNRFSGVPGRTILDAARQPAYSPKLILVHRFSEAQAAGTSMSGGAFHWIWKPFRKDEVRAALGFALMQCQREWERYLRGSRSVAPTAGTPSGSDGGQVLAGGEYG
jgi:DNA-binding NtrC family response regulator